MYKLILITCLLCLNNNLKGQEFLFTDSVFNVYAAKLNPSDEIKSATPVPKSEISFDYLKFLDPNYALLMILKVETFGFTYYQFELAKGKGLVKRKTVLFNYSGKYLQEFEHDVKTF